MNVDKTFCASPDCKNDCDRKMDDKQKQFIKGHPWYPVSYAYFCGEPEKMISEDINHELISKDIDNP